MEIFTDIMHAYFLSGHVLYNIAKRSSMRIPQLPVCLVPTEQTDRIMDVLLCNLMQIVQHFFDRKNILNLSVYLLLITLELYNLMTMRRFTMYFFWE